MASTSELVRQSKLDLNTLAGISVLVSACCDEQRLLEVFYLFIIIQKLILIMMWPVSL